MGIEAKKMRRVLTTSSICIATKPLKVEKLNQNQSSEVHVIAKPLHTINPG
jgi:hypothetical protein